MDAKEQVKCYEACQEFLDGRVDDGRTRREAWPKELKTGIELGWNAAWQVATNQSLEDAAKIADGYIGCSHIADKILDLKRH